MNKTIGLLASASVAAAAAAVSAAPAHAEGTSAGTTITNQVTLNYKVGGVDQNEVTASDSFTVDRKVNLLVAEVGSTTTKTRRLSSAATSSRYETWVSLAASKSPLSSLST